MTHSLPRAVSPQSIPPGVALDHPSLYFSRELSWLDFNSRVLAQALDPRLPLLERVRFLGITASNLDEFVQKRIGGLKRQEAARVRRRFADGRTPSEQLPLVRSFTRRMEREIDSIWVRELKPALDRELRVRIVPFATLSAPRRRKLGIYFREHLYPILTPLSVDPGHPFPFISNLSLSLAIELDDAREEAPQFARVKVPTRVGRWVPIPGARGRREFVAVEEVIRHHIHELFRGVKVLGAYAFRVTRNADVERSEEEAEDLIAMISEELRERRLAPVVRLEVEQGMPAKLRELLLDELELDAEELVELEGELALADAAQLAGLDSPEHQFEPWLPVLPSRLADEDGVGRRSIFSVIREADVLVHHPYESFPGSVQRLIEEAAEDPDVLAIKQTLYRTSDESPIVEALLRAAERGKQVAVMVEVKARFDEQNNIEWARILETAGIHVTYGLIGLKTHAKLLLIVREEGGHPRAYCHIGTGNYHIRNAELYTDLGLLTCDPELGADVINLFHHLTGYAPGQSYRRLIVAPDGMRKAFKTLIHREIEHQRGGRRGRIIAKMNALDDPRLIRKLYEASQAGVRIDLVVRGHCCLRPGVPGVSDQIRVTSIVGRFLEHDRIFYFENGGEPEVFIGSADWRVRNLEERVEAAAPVRSPPLLRRLIGILELALADNQLAWELDTSGDYHRVQPAPGDPLRNLHRTLMTDALARRRREEKMPRVPLSQED